MLGGRSFVDTEATNELPLGIEAKTAHDTCDQSDKATDLTCMYSLKMLFE